MQEKVIDVSRYNGTIDWAKVKADGIFGAIVRVGVESSQNDSSRLDSQAIRNLNGATAAGIHTGAYLYATARSAAQAAKEANWLADVLEPYKGKLDMPIYYDVEGRIVDALSGYALTDVIISFVKTLESRGWWTGLYTGKYVMQSLTQSVGCTIWIAQYPYSDKRVTWDEMRQAKSSYTGAHDMWQFTPAGRVRGISDDVDCSWLYRDLPAAIKDAGLNGYKKPVKGDVDGDGEVTMGDARKALRQAIGLEKPTAAADYDGDGEVTAEDARSIINDALGEIRH